MEEAHWKLGGPGRGCLVLVLLALNQLEVLASQRPALLANQLRPPTCLALNQRSQLSVHLVHQRSQQLPEGYLVPHLSQGGCLDQRQPPRRQTPLALEPLGRLLQPLGHLLPSSQRPRAALGQQQRLSLEVSLAQASAVLHLLQAGGFLGAQLNQQPPLEEEQVLSAPRHQRPQVLVEAFLPLGLSRISLALGMSSLTLSSTVTQ